MSQKASIQQTRFPGFSVEKFVVLWEILRLHSVTKDIFLSWDGSRPKSGAVTTYSGYIAKDDEKQKKLENGLYYYALQNIEYFAIHIQCSVVIIFCLQQKLKVEKMDFARIIKENHIYCIILKTLINTNILRFILRIKNLKSLIF